MNDHQIALQRLAMDYECKLAALSMAHSMELAECDRRLARERRYSRRLFDEWRKMRRALRKLERKLLER